MVTTTKARLDVLMVDRGLCRSREQAHRYILAGEVWSGARRLEKPGTRLPVGIELEVRLRAQPYASRGGLKLEHAITRFVMNITKRTCLDIGASTGGFTDCLLKRGAARVFAVDVGVGQLEHSLRNDPRVVNIERTNARHLRLEDLKARSPSARAVSLICIDVSFISLRIVVDSLRRHFPFVPEWILLFKPQFEVGRRHVRRGGVADPVEAKASYVAFDRWMGSVGFTLKHGPEPCPVTGKKSGNIEYLVHYELS